MGELEIDFKVGETRSGIPVFMNEIFREPTLTKMPTKELFDAYIIFMYLTIKEKRKHGKTKEYEIFEKNTQAIKQKIDKKENIKKLETNAGIKSAFDYHEYALKLVLPEYRS